MSRARRTAALLLLPLAAVIVGAAPSAAQDGPTLPRGVLVVVVPEVSFEQLLADAQIRALVARGGAGLMPSTEPTLGTLTTAFPNADVYPLPTGAVDLRLTILEQGSGPAPAPLRELGDQVRRYVQGWEVGDLLLFVVGDGISSAMRAEKDRLVPVVMASGPPAELFVSDGDPGSLTSDSTRRAGVVTVEDLATTIVDFVGDPIPGNPRALAETGSPIRVLDEPAPFELHERYLAQRRLYVPFGTAAAIYVTVVGLLGAAFLWLGGRVPGTVRRAAGWACLSAAATGTALLAAGHLPQLTYAAAVPFVAIVTVFGTMAFSPLERRGAVWVPAGIGAGVLGFFVVEALLGWGAMLTPLLGGTHLDGGRFYGLPNVAIGLVVGASLWLAQRLRTWIGVGLLVAVALGAGMPYLGSNLGAGVTLFAAAGLWLAVRERERLGPWTGVAVVALAVVGGTALILLAHRLSPLPTHVTRFEETAGGLAGVWDTFVDRLGIGVDLIRRNPAAAVPVVGLLASLAVALRPPAAIATTFERWPAWRDAVVVCLLAGIVAYVANDTGAAAAGLAFGLGLGGMLGVSLLAGPGKMVEP